LAATVVLLLSLARLALVFNARPVLPLTWLNKVFKPALAPVCHSHARPGWLPDHGFLGFFIPWPAQPKPGLGFQARLWPWSTPTWPGS